MVKKSSPVVDKRHRTLVVMNDELIARIELYRAELLRDSEIVRIPDRGEAVCIALDRVLPKLPRRARRDPGRNPSEIGDNVAA